MLVRKGYRSFALIESRGARGGGRAAWRSANARAAIWAASHGLVVLHLAGKLSAKPGFRELHRQMMQLLVRGARTMATAPEAATVRVTSS